MSRVVRTVEITPADGVSLTAHEIMVACAEVPSDLKPEVLVRLNGQVKKLTFKVTVVPDGR